MTTTNTKKHSYSYIDNGESAVIIPMDGSYESLTVHSTNPNYAEIMELVKTGGDPQRVFDLAKPAAGIANKLASNDYNGIQIIDGVLLYEEEPVIGSLADRIVRLWSEGFDLEPLALFAERLWRNPREEIRQELDQFLERCNLPITPDGHFLAYKIVDLDYMDLYTHTISNKIGERPSMERDKVDPNRHNLCSYGLHFCSKEYLPNYGSARSGGSRVMLVKISPEDVIAIPTDYDFSKGRTCSYEVVAEISFEKASADQWPALVTEYGSPEVAKVVTTVNDKKATKQTKAKSKSNKAKKGVSIQTKQLGELHQAHFANAIAKHGSMAAWAKAHGWAPGTVRDWKKRLIAAGAKGL